MSSLVGAFLCEISVHEVAAYLRKPAEGAPAARHMPVPPWQLQRGPSPSPPGRRAPGPLGNAPQPTVIYVALVQLMRFVPGDS